MEVVSLDLRRRLLEADVVEPGERRSRYVLDCVVRNLHADDRNTLLKSLKLYIAMQVPPHLLYARLACKSNVSEFERH